MSAFVAWDGNAEGNRVRLVANADNRRVAAEVQRIDGLGQTGWHPAPENVERVVLCRALWDFLMQPKVAP